MSGSKISRAQIQKIIAEEISRLSEDVDHTQIKDVVTVASKLMSAIESFKSSAPQAVLNALTPNIDTISKSLEDMVSNPSSYVTRQKPAVKKISLKQVKNN